MSNLTKLYIFITILTLFSACREGESPAPELSTKIRYYAPYSVGSSFSYNSSLGAYTNIVESDTIIAEKVYKKVLNSRDSFTSYYYFEEGEYKVSGTAPLYVSGVPAELKDFTYLKDNLPEGSTWSVFVPVNSGQLKYTARFDFKIIEKETTRTVNSKYYSGVVYVQEKIYTVYNDVINEVGTYDFWYAKGVGLIETDALDTKIANYRIK